MNIALLLGGYVLFGFAVALAGHLLMKLVPESDTDDKTQLISRDCDLPGEWHEEY